MIFRAHRVLRPITLLLPFFAHTLFTGRRVTPLRRFPHLLPESLHENSVRPCIVDLLLYAPRAVKGVALFAGTLYVMLHSLRIAIELIAANDRRLLHGNERY
jgi:hypothetical protein